MTIFRPHIATFRFYEELNDFLPPEHRKRDFLYRFDGSPSVKDAIEAIGAPHTEVDLILLNGKPTGFDSHIRDGDRISVYPVFESIDISGVTRIRSNALRNPSFILDVHLGTLARYLRMIGFDSLYGDVSDDHEIVRIASDEGRIILTRDRGLLKHGMVTRGYWVRSTIPLEQVAEVIARFDLAGLAKPFTRCLRCNGIVREIDKSDVLDILDENTARFFNRFTQCKSCGNVYWEGSHYELMRKLLQSMVI
jgi:uncharacterized protein